ncbi:uncharacterized protein N0V89_007617 [Didymosphaeria variabile]|uniref:Uncharacterized protein n=1 Tax=Didymosphaeria variabile TaxID=1932322 RepID=A0A9W9CAD1_9PLEO|nr:uncharacterized protein N0V89_007617 [Didymosphaeria variabile]KAJ4352270.1 hypothetical protein N0V89_007617 [Didymosphaeria variabile]
MVLWPCDEHMAGWWRWRKTVLEGAERKQSARKRKQGTGADDSKTETGTSEPKACTCGPDAARELCRAFFEATRNFWPMLWKDDRLRATVAACEEAGGMRPIELDRMPGTSAYRCFFQLACGSAWTGVPRGVDEYYRYVRMRALYADRKRTLTNIAGWHSLASVPAGALAVLLNDVACDRDDAVFYMWVPVVWVNVPGSLGWKCHYGTLLMVHRAWTSQAATRKTWRGRSFQARYEWCRASNQIVDDQAGVLRLPLLRFEDRKQLGWFTQGNRSPANGKIMRSPAVMALRPQPPYLLQGAASLGSSQAPGFAGTLGRLENPSAVGDFDGLHEKCMREWIPHAKPWHGVLAGLLSPHAASTGQEGAEAGGLVPSTSTSPTSEAAEPPQRRRKRSSEEAAVSRPDARPVPPRQNELDPSDQPRLSMERPWPEQRLTKASMTKIKDWLIDVRGYEREARRWKWARVERTAREENDRITAATSLQEEMRSALRQHTRTEPAERDASW